MRFFTDGQKNGPVLWTGPQGITGKGTSVGRHDAAVVGVDRADTACLAYKDIGECLSEGISFFKINQEELSHLMECQTPKPEEMDRFRKSHGIEVLAVTDGANPAILCTENGIYRIRIPRLEACCNPIGAGDTCDAVLFSEVLENRELPEAFALGLAAATASCMTREPAVFARDEAENLYKQTGIERMG